MRRIKMACVIKDREVVIKASDREGVVTVAIKLFEGDRSWVRTFAVNVYAIDEALSGMDAVVEALFGDDHDEDDAIVELVNELKRFATSWTVA